MCQLKLPQQVALTEFKGQVGAKVKVILMTESEFISVSRHCGLVLVRCTSQVQLPQQVALTAFKGQVSTKVRVIIVTMDTRGLYRTKTTPKRCTYEFIIKNDSIWGDLSLFAPTNLPWTLEKSTFPRMSSYPMFLCPVSSFRYWVCYDCQELNTLNRVSVWYLTTITLHSRHLHLIGLLVLLLPTHFTTDTWVPPILPEISSVFAFNEFKGKVSNKVG